MYCNSLGVQQDPFSKTLYFKPLYMNCHLRGESTQNIQVLCKVTDFIKETLRRFGTKARLWPKVPVSQSHRLPLHLPVAFLLLHQGMEQQEAGALALQPEGEGGISMGEAN